MYGYSEQYPRLSEKDLEKRYLFDDAVAGHIEYFKEKDKWLPAGTVASVVTSGAIHRYIRDAKIKQNRIDQFFVVDEAREVLREMLKQQRCFKNFVINCFVEYYECHSFYDDLMEVSSKLIYQQFNSKNLYVRYLKFFQEPDNSKVRKLPGNLKAKLAFYLQRNNLM